MARADIRKQPWEEYPIGADFSDDYETGEAIALATSVVIAIDLSDGSTVTTVKDGDPFRATNPDYSNAKTNAMLCQKIKGGSSGDRYKFTFRGVSNLGNRFEKDIFVKIAET